MYDLEASAEAMEKANITGTKGALEFAEAVNAGCFHLVSSIAAAGLYRGTFTEDMFEEAEELDHPYHRTKHDSEAMVRANGRIPFRVYRPGAVLGHSQTGFIDKIDGPYYFFKALQRLRESWPRWIPLVGIEGGYINVVPVDFVVDALVHLSHQPKLDGRCFHLTDPKVRRVGEMLNVFARAAHAPEMAFRLDPKVFAMVPEPVTQSVERSKPIQNVFNQLLRDLQVPRSVLQFVNYPTRFDSTATQKILDKAKIRVPALEDYAWRLWDYWERHLDPDLSIDRSLKGAVKGKVVMITGGSSGIGEAAAIRIAEAGGKVIVVARDEEKLAEVRKKITDAGGFVKTYSCDITEYAANDKLAKDVLKEFGHVDVLINNAGRSIRRSLALSYDRFHDFERTMQLNYFACVRLTMNLLPSMTARKDGHVINVSSIGVLTNAPRFSAYVASKAALESFARCAAVRVPRRERALHDHQHAARAHADDRADEAVRGNADDHFAGRSGGHDRGCDHPQAAAHRDAPRRHLRDHASRHAEDVRGRHEFGLPHVPGFRRRAGQARRRGTAAGDPRSDDLCVPDAGHSLVK